MRTRVLVTEGGSEHHLPQNRQFGTSTEPLCNRHGAYSLQEDTLSKAKRKGYGETCSQCQVRQNATPTRHREDSVQTPEEKVAYIRSLREGAD